MAEYGNTHGKQEHALESVGDSMRHRVDSVEAVEGYLAAGSPLSKFEGKTN